MSSEYNANQIQVLEGLEAVRRRRPVAADVEITVEANPGTVTPELLEELREAGFNRISFGLQDCEDEMLRLLAADGMLVKRPLLVGEDFVLVGFKEGQWGERLERDHENYILKI